MKFFGRILAAAVLIVGAGIVFVQWKNSNPPENVPALPVPPSPESPSSPVSTPSSSSGSSGSPQVEPQPSPSIEYPVSSESAQPLPSLDESDPSLEGALVTLFGKDRFKELFSAANLIRKIVVTEENLSGHKQPTDEFSPLKGLSSGFRVNKKGGETTLSSSNFGRYAPYVKLATATDAKKLVDVYKRFYPLFQAAYLDLGKPGYFNDHLVHLIDHLLTTPEVEGPISLMQLSKHSRYRYVDDHLESLSSGQKILVRMGTANSRALKGKLREIRSLLVHQGKP